MIWQIHCCLRRILFPRFEKKAGRKKFFRGGLWRRYKRARLDWSRPAGFRDERGHEKPRERDNGLTALPTGWNLETRRFPAARPPRCRKSARNAEWRCVQGWSTSP